MASFISPYAMLLIVMSFYFAVFILDLLNVKVDDGTGLIHEYEKIRKINEKLLRDEEARIEAESKAKLDRTIYEYTGDAKHPWDSPFARPLFMPGQARKNEELQELHNQLEESIYFYLYQHLDSIPEPELKVDEEAEARMDSLVKRQELVEERFDKVSRLPTSLRARDYGYRSPLNNMDLTVPPTPSNLDELAVQKPKSVGSMFSSVVSSVFGGKSSEEEALTSTEKIEDDDNEGNAFNQGDATTSSAEVPDSVTVPVPGSGTFAVLADPAKNPKSASVMALEQALTVRGFDKHSGSGLPLWMIAYGRSCPNPKAIVSKDPTGQHIVFCAAYTNGQGARSVFTDANEFDIAAQHLVPEASLEASSFKNDVAQFYRFYDANDRALLQEETTSSSATAVLVFQASGSGKPQLVQASSLSGLLEKEQFVVEKPKIVGTPLLPKQMLWPGSQATFMVRSWLVIERAAPALLAAFYPGDIVKSKVDFVEFQGREAADTTTAMRFPAYADDAEHLPLADHLGELPSNFLDRLRRAAVYAALRFGASREADGAQAGLKFVQHICLDFIVRADEQTPVLLTTTSNCDIESSSAQTKESITTELIKSLVSGSDEIGPASIVVDQANSFVFN
mmetsp:Transcript_2075/g.4732  ORF Transcript_2075/g.4732 Transcript_2075/m.4732 type:complete len:622 (+) Transcript_2075:291-2156(+)|eukprot:CAMPEP_0171493770 /NCGR_PEP_ID=MMETSP0958-20121227/5146_1 /TAXON_ID=87120 /ORGANISM="Aurantiochytrium limacinum, Strain ATCCMYA-1381" /LENGTH=621 /DNA_ID=CAMNT_0012027429 /DNA_START=168 /DNA_END=2033 /DNA_ORIENTATION=-